MRILFFVALSLFSVALFAQDTVTFVNKKTDKTRTIDLYEPCIIKFNSGKTVRGVIYGYDNSVIFFRTNLSKKWKPDWERKMDSIQFNSSNSRRERKKQVMTLINPDTIQFGFDSIKCLTFRSFNSISGYFKLIGSVVVFAGCSTAFFIFLDEQRHRNFPIGRLYLSGAATVASLYLVWISNTKKIKTKKWQLKGD